MERKNLRFLSLASGSSGNCYYIGTEDCGILVDAGIGARTIRRRLKVAGIDISSIMGVFVTHDHADHIKSVGVFGEVLHIPVYATETIHKGINKNYKVTEKLTAASQRYVEKNKTIGLKDFQITAFPVSHDGSDNVGYTIEYGQERFTLATDLGYIGEEVANQIRLANHLVLEANYDDEMLMNGSYSSYLKSRIRGKNGHMSNADTASFLSENYADTLNDIYLCHLSKDNNTPQIAFDAVASSLTAVGVKVGEDVNLYALERTTPSQLFQYK